MNDNLLIMCGGKITFANDELKKINVQYLVDKLRVPSEKLELMLRNLRVVKEIDEKQYRELKKQLPYIVNGIFNPPFRKTENFAYIESFIVDLDHLSEKQIGLVSLRNMIEQDSRVLLTFVSPSEDGLKVMFRLKERCCDATIFKLFYKEFVKKFAVQYNIMQVLDSVTCDVTRACFMSMDKNVYYNENAELIDINSFIDKENSVEMFSLLNEVKKEEKEIKQQEIKIVSGPDDEALAKIKQILTGKIPKIKPKKPPIEVAEELNIIMPNLIEYVKKYNIEIYEVINIQNAKKIKAKMGLKLAEINLFYGKRGFSVVASPKSGTDYEFNDVLKNLISVYIAEN